MGPYMLFLLFVRRIPKLIYFVRDKEVGILKKLLVFFGVIYLISPIDLIPFPVLGFSIIDDLVLWIFILNYLGESLDKYNNGNTNDNKDEYKDKTIIDNVDYEIKTDDMNDDINEKKE